MIATAQRGEKGLEHNVSIRLPQPLQIAPQHQLSNLGLGMIKLKEGDIETAEHLLSQASEDLSGINVEAFTALALARLQLGKQDAAKSILDQGLKAFPKSEELRTLKAGTLLSEGRAATAMKLLDEVLYAQLSTCTYRTTN